MDKKFPLLIVSSFLIVIVEHISSIHAVNGTIFPLIPYNKEMALADAKKLHNVFSERTFGEDLDTETIKNILTNRTYQQRHMIATSYFTKYYTRIVDCIRANTKGCYRGILKALFMDIFEFYAHDLYNGIHHKDDYTLIQILTVASKSAEMVKNVTREFKKNHGEELFEAIGKSDFKDSNFNMAMQKILTVERQPDTPKINTSEVTTLVQKLNSVVQKLHSDLQKNVDFEALDDVLITLISTPFNVLRSVTLEYKTTYENELYDDLHEKLDGSLGKLYRSLARFVNNEEIYFAEVLRSAVIGPGTKESILTRCIVCLSEYNLADVKKAYETKYGISLAARLDDDLSGKYQEILMALLKEPHYEQDR